MRSLVEAAEYVMTVVRELGFDPSESSRLAQMRDLLLRRGFIKETDPDFEVACEALRDVTLLEFAFDQLKGVVPVAALRSKVRLVAKDSPLPQDDQSSTPGRDAQSELHVAAVCQAAGLTPRLSEPDVVVDLDGRTYGLAVKRLKSLAKTETRFREAVGQIDKSGMPGFVVLDMVLAANPENKRLSFLIRDTAFLAFQKRRFDPFLDSHVARFITWRAGREVRGVLVLDHVVGRVDEEGHWGLRGFTVFSDLDPYNQRRRKEASGFFEAYKAGMPFPFK